MYSGVLRKMLTENLNPIRYFLKLEQGFINLNQCLDKKLSIKWINSICLNCKIEKDIFRQGYCKSCFFEIPQTADWVMKPELSQAHLNIEYRDLKYEKKIQLQSHYIYFANTSHLKVGVTRKTQIPFRWIDQGANQTIILLELPNRYLAGIGELKLKEFFSDKTNWRKMLTSENDTVDLKEAYKKGIENLPLDLKKYIKSNTYDIINLKYPVNEYPKKVNSLKLQNKVTYEGKLTGIKGQYLIFEDQSVFNVRSNEGKVVEISIN
jgi:hypothetical protein